MLENLNGDDSMDGGHRINQRHLFNFQDPVMPLHGNGGLRNLPLNNPFGRNFVIINDLDDGFNVHLGYLHHCHEQDTNADSNSL